MSKTLVLFDFDGTLTKRDTFPQFIFFSRGYAKGLIGFFIHSPFIFLFLVKLMNGAKLKEKLVAFYFKGENGPVLYKNGKAFIEKLNKENHLNQDLLQKLEYYKSQNHSICVVSASLDVWIKPFCEERNIDFLCTELEFVNRVSNGKLRTPNCNGTEKSIRIKQKYDLSTYSNIIAYGNSDGDRAMFELATETHLIKNN